MAQRLNMNFILLNGKCLIPVINNIFIKKKITWIKWKTKIDIVSR